MSLDSRCRAHQRAIRLVPEGSRVFVEVAAGLQRLIKPLRSMLGLLAVFRNIFGFCQQQGAAAIETIPTGSEKTKGLETCLEFLRRGVANIAKGDGLFLRQ